MKKKNKRQNETDPTGDTCGEDFFFFWVSPNFWRIAKLERSECATVIAKKKSKKKKAKKTSRSTNMALLSFFLSSSSSSSSSFSSWSRSSFPIGGSRPHEGFPQLCHRSTPTLWTEFLMQFLQSNHHLLHHHLLLLLLFLILLLLPCFRGALRRSSFFLRLFRRFVLIFYFDFFWCFATLLASIDWNQIYLNKERKKSNDHPWLSLAKLDSISWSRQTPQCVCCRYFLLANISN